ncbi:MAG: gamma carbonic anhydrase family protein [Anaerovoracaceae bacterium]
MIKPYKNNLPQVAEQVYIAENASVIGNVTLERRASVWFGTVIRGDNAAITIGEDTNIQDNSTLHCAPGMPLRVGDRVTVGHNVVLHSCTVEDDCLIGMGAVIMNHAVIGKNSIVGAGALVTEGKEFPENSLIVGSPAKVKRQLTEADLAAIRESAEEYLQLAKEYQQEYQPMEESEKK